MSKQIKLRAQSKRTFESKPVGWTIRRSNGAYYVREGGRVGYGNTYGERTYNNRPVDAGPVNGSRGYSTRKVPFDPFDAP